MSVAACAVAIDLAARDLPARLGLVTPTTPTSLFDNTELACNIMHDTVVCSKGLHQVIHPNGGGVHAFRAGVPGSRAGRGMGRVAGLPGDGGVRGVGGVLAGA